MNGYQIEIMPKNKGMKNEDITAQIDEIILEAEQNELQELKWISAKQLKEYALPSAFDLYRVYLK